jgi:carboxypeptidase Taq
MQKIADIRNSISVLGWDQETYQPPMGADFRGQQIATLSGLAHDLFLNADLENVLNELKNDVSLNAIERKNVEISCADLQREKKYTTAFVEENSKAISEAYHAWAEARKKSDFQIFAPKLKKLVELKRAETKLLGYENHPYNALLDLYEPNQTVADTDILFDDLKKELVPFIKTISEKPKPKNGFMFGNFPKQNQWQLGIELLKQMNFDFNAGRQDESLHPFTTTFAPTDVRLTTHIEEKDFYTMIWSCLHEGGHGLYEQGLPAEQYGLPGCEAVSLGIHESQSRLWENMVGRSFLYWKNNFKTVQQFFPGKFENVTAADFYKAINLVEPSLIRIEADELTYHFHVIIRYEIEKMLLDGSLEIENIPAIWNKKYFDYLGVKVPNDAMGCLQDIHWSHGSFGYFPTYTIGSLYAAQFFHFAKKEIAGLDAIMIENGELKPLLDWLRNKIHQHGRLKSAKEISESICGEPLNVKYFVDYAKEKFGDLYP